MPSLASIFPFLEAIRPEDSPAWHIDRARLLHRYEAAWIIHYGQSSAENPMELISLCGELLVDIDKLAMCRGCMFILLLIPRAWEVKGICDQLLETCARVVSSARPGKVIRRDEFDLY